MGSVEQVRCTNYFGERRMAGALCIAEANSITLLNAGTKDALMATSPQASQRLE
jgi:hypothetical protein